MRRSLSILFSLKGINVFKPVIENPMLHCKHWYKTTERNFHSMPYIHQKPIWNAINGERTQCDSSWLDRLVCPLEHVQKIKYDNIKFISISFYCPGEMRYLPFYSLLVKQLTSLILVFYLVPQMKVCFWLCKFFVLAWAHWQEVLAEKKFLQRAFLSHLTIITLHCSSKTWEHFEPSSVQQSNKTVPRCSWLLQLHHI